MLGRHSPAVGVPCGALPCRPSASSASVGGSSHPAKPNALKAKPSLRCAARSQGGSTARSFDVDVAAGTRQTVDVGVVDDLVDDELLAPQCFSILLAL